MKKTRLRLWPLLLALVLLCGGCALPGLAPAQVPDSSETAALLPPTAPLAQAGSAGELTAVFFDVGQADSILIGTGGHYMLVDAGVTGQDNLLKDYLAAYGVTKLDYLVATHPHADHIGAMAAVVYDMGSIGEVLMPEAIATTTTFEKLLDAIEQRGLEITVPSPGDSFALGAATVQVLAPLSSDYKDVNNYSIVLRISFGEVSFLLTGDAEALSEDEQLQVSRDLRADVLKVGHHGSNSSSTEEYLDAVSPAYAVISCGKDNSYGHPHAEVLQRLAERNVVVYRTDECGTVKMVTDGNDITVTSTGGAQPALAPTENAAAGYIGNRNSQVFHLPSCATLPAEHNRVFFAGKEEAIAEGYRGCQACKP